MPDGSVASKPSTVRVLSCESNVVGRDLLSTFVSVVSRCNDQYVVACPLVHCRYLVVRILTRNVRGYFRVSCSRRDCFSAAIGADITYACARVRCRDVLRTRRGGEVVDEVIFPRIFHLRTVRALFTFHDIPCLRYFCYYCLAFPPVYERCVQVKEATLNSR